MSEWAEWRDKQNFAIILQTEAAELAWNHKQTEVDRLTAKLKQRDFQDEVLEETGRLLDKSRAEVDRLKHAIRYRDGMKALENQAEPAEKDDD